MFGDANKPKNLKISNQWGQVKDEVILLITEGRNLAENSSHLTLPLDQGFFYDAYSKNPYHGI